MTANVARASIDDLFRVPFGVCCRGWWFVCCAKFMIRTSVVPPMYLRSQARHSGTGVPAIKIRGAPRPNSDGSVEYGLLQ